MEPRRPRLRSPSRRRPLLRVALVLGVGLLLVGCVAAVAAQLGGSDARASLAARIRPLPLAAGVIGWVVASVLAGPRFRDALPPEARSRAPSGVRLGVWMLGVHALNLALPGPAGDLAFIGVLSRGHEVRTRDLVAATTWSRVLGLATIAALGLLVLPLAPTDGLLASGLVGALVLLGVSGTILGALVLRPDLLGRLADATVGALAEVLPGPLGRLCGRVGGALHALAAGLSDVSAAGIPLVLRTVGWSVLIQLSLALSLLCAAAAVGIPLSPRSLATVHVTAELSAVAVAFAPAGLGGFDGVLGAALVSFADAGAMEAALVVLSLRLVQILALGAGAIGVAAIAPGLLDSAAAPAGGDAAPGESFPGRR